MYIKMFNKLINNAIYDNYEIFAPKEILEDLHILC